jgi:hypothetical protein
MTDESRNAVEKNAEKQPGENAENDMRHLADEKNDDDGDDESRRGRMNAAHGLQLFEESVIHGGIWTEIDEIILSHKVDKTRYAVIIDTKRINNSAAESHFHGR